MSRSKPKHKLGPCNHQFRYNQIRIRFVGISRNGLPLVICPKCGLLWERQSVGKDIRWQQRQGQTFRMGGFASKGEN